MRACAFASRANACAWLSASESATSTLLMTIMLASRSCDSTVRRTARKSKSMRDASNRVMTGAWLMTAGPLPSVYSVARFTIQGFATPVGSTSTNSGWIFSWIVESVSASWPEIWQQIQPSGSSLASRPKSSSTRASTDTSPISFMMMAVRIPRRLRDPATSMRSVVLPLPKKPVI